MTKRELLRHRAALYVLGADHAAGWLAAAALIAPAAVLIPGAVFDWSWDFMVFCLLGINLASCGAVAFVARVRATAVAELHVPLDFL